MVVESSPTIMGAQDVSDDAQPSIEAMEELQESPGLMRRMSFLLIKSELARRLIQLPPLRLFDLSPPIFHV
jgi:hypothetical protein